LIHGWNVELVCGGNEEVCTVYGVENGEFLDDLVDSKFMLV
jgi:hypothetical protein